jgi:hypothetical protein
MVCEFGWPDRYGCSFRIVCFDVCDDELIVRFGNRLSTIQFAFLTHRKIGEW